MISGFGLRQMMAAPGAERAVDTAAIKAELSATRQKASEMESVSDQFVANDEWWRMKVGMPACFATVTVIFVPAICPAAVWPMMGVGACVIGLVLAASFLSVRHARQAARMASEKQAEAARLQGLSDLAAMAQGPERDPGKVELTASQVQIGKLRVARNTGAAGGAPPQ